MNHPTDEQIDHAAEMLAEIRGNGNVRPGDDLWAMTDEQKRQQLRARATDMLVIILSQDDVLRG